MNCCVVILLLGSLFTVGHCVYPPAGTCDSYSNISQSWRHITYAVANYQGTPNDDAGLVGKWIRFVGIGGDRIHTLCTFMSTGGTKNPIHVEEYCYNCLYELDTVVTGNVFGFVSSSSSCVRHGFTIDIVYCPGGFFIYKPKVHPAGGEAGYVTQHSKCGPGVCGPNATCLGPGACFCAPGFQQLPGTVPTEETFGCLDIQECEVDPGRCGDHAFCTNFVGGFNCTCDEGFNVTDGANPISVTNQCIDIEECVQKPTICGSSGNCTNTFGSFFCTCFSGYRLFPDKIGVSDPCIDIDECSETPGLCGALPQSICTNVPGSYYCSCTDGFYPSTGLVWISSTICKSLQDHLAETVPPKGQSKEITFLLKVAKQARAIVQDLKILPDLVVENCFSACMEVAGVGPRVQKVKVGIAGDAESGSLIADIAENLMTAMVDPKRNESTIRLLTPTMDLHLLNFAPLNVTPKTAFVSANETVMDVDMESAARDNNGNATAASMVVLNGLDSLLSHKLFETENRTEMMANVITATLPKMNSTDLTEPVNFTIQHKQPSPEAGLVSCVYWNVSIDQLIEYLSGEADKKKEEAITMSWSVEGCWVSYSNENFTVCSCSHLSTFALILQTGEPPPENDFLNWLNRICVIIGLFFFALAILTFLLCSWNPKINNTARLHLCINLGSSHLLLLFNEMYLANQMACKAFAGILHFLVVASFVWMLLEAVQLYLLVRRLNKVQVIERDGLPQPVLYIIGYGVPFVIVGVSALVYHRGYGATPAKVCWLSQTRNFNWALTAPVITVLVLNCLLFCATLWSLRTTLANMKSGASENKDTKLVLFKIVAQFVILGCTWILGLYQSNLFFQILFIVLNSQQGTFLYIVHCLLNKEVREECLKCLTCSNRRKETGHEVSVSEDLDKTK